MRRFILPLAVLAFLTFGPLRPAASQDRPAKLTVTYVSAPLNLPLIVMVRKGLLNDAMTPLGIKVETPEITAGAKQVQALAAGSIDVASVLGDAPAILGRANGVDLTVIAAFSRSPEAYVIMAMPGGPKRIEDLKGKQVAGPKGSTLNQLLLAALASKHLSIDDVQYVNMDIPLARAALLAGRIDAATLAGNDQLAVEEAGGKTIATGKGLIAPTTVVVVRRDFLTRYPDVVRRYLGAQRAAIAYMRAHQAEAIQLAADELKIAPRDARRMLPWYDFSPTITDRDVANIEADQSFLIKNAMLERPIDIRRDLISPIAMQR